MKAAMILALAGLTFAQAPIGDAPAGCDKSYDGKFEITLVKPSNLKRDLVERQDASTCGQEGILTLTLQNGNLMDVTGKTGYIASNNSQFQFDKPVQAGGIYAGQFSVCKNGSIALGDTTNFYQCQSGGFYNLYYKATAEQCSPVNFDIIPCDGSKPANAGASSAPAASGAAPVSAHTDGQPQATAAATMVAPKPVSVFTDGQPQATVAATSKAANNVTAATAVPTIATAGGAANTVSVLFAGAMAVLALF